MSAASRNKVATDIFHCSHSPGRYVRAPTVEESDDDPDDGNVGIDLEVNTPRLGFHLPKIPKMESKPNAHEKLIEWKRYKRAIGYYFNLLPRGVSSDRKLQLLYLGGGPEIQRALEHFSLPSDKDEDGKFEAITAHLDEFFKTGVDGLAYVLQFFKLAQKEDELFADFAQRLKTHADLCDLGSARDNLLKARFKKEPVTRKFSSRLKHG